MLLEESSSLQLSESVSSWLAGSLLEAAHNSLLCKIPQNSHLLPHSEDEKDSSKMDTSILRSIIIYIPLPLLCSIV